LKACLQNQELPPTRNMKFDSPTNTLLKALNKPPFIYGTAWKKDQTHALIQAALSAGFRAVDTACQPRHYREDLVGSALRAAYGAGIVKRDDIFLQTKFTAPGGQDPDNCPYDTKLGVEEMVKASIAVSFKNLRELDDEASKDSTVLDCVLLHSPLRSVEDTIAAWKVLETYVPARIRHLGISNTDLPVLKAVYAAVTVKPTVVQNRLYSQTRWDTALRRFCAENGIVYQSFWTLTGNPQLLKSEPVQTLAKEAGVSKEVALYCLVIELGIAPLNGTTNEGRMKSDLEDALRVRNWTFVYGTKWASITDQFKSIIGET
jgi:diketogulonate reductase-like aldo/keto reductase